MSKVKRLVSAIATSVLLVSTSSPVRAELEDSPKTVVDVVWQIVHNEFVDHTRKVEIL